MATPAKPRRAKLDTVVNSAVDMLVFRPSMALNNCGVCEAFTMLVFSAWKICVGAQTGAQNEQATARERVAKAHL